MKIKVLLFSVGVALPIIAAASFMNALSGFSLRHEAILKSPAKAGQLIRSGDGGYFVVGDMSYPQVSKTDQVGGLLWTYEAPVRNSEVPHLEAATPTPDGGALLCGWRRRGQIGPQAGLLIRLDRNGHEVWRVEPSIDSQTHTLVYFKACTRIDNDFIVIGNGTVRDSAPGKSSNLTGVYMFMRVRSDGSVIWQKDLDLGDGGGTNNSIPRLMKNGDFVFMGLQYIVRIDSEGNLRASEKTDGACYLIQRADSSDSLQMICDPFTDMKARLFSLNSNLQPTQGLSLKNEGLTSLTQAYIRADGSIIFFCSTKSEITSFVPTLLLYSAEGTLVDTYRFSNMPNVAGIAGAIATDVDGEFVMIRTQGDPVSHTVMTFLRHK